MVRLLIQQPRLMSEIEPNQLCAHFEASPLKTIVQVLAAQGPKGDDDQLRHKLYDLLPDEATKNLFTRLSLEPDCSDDLETARVMLDDRIGTLRERRTKRHRQQLQDDLRQAEQQGDSVRIAQLIKELQALHAARNCADEDPTPDDLSGR